MLTWGRRPLHIRWYTDRLPPHFIARSSRRRPTPGSRKFGNLHKSQDSHPQQLASSYYNGSQLSERVRASISFQRAVQVQDVFLVARLEGSVLRVGSRENESDGVGALPLAL